ncbi:hypothetical protein FRC01_008871 [Tulasnella sp. 417]|nr:hypothetical protein FRC01_008871 [Tulasnella sp. 417]
MAAAFKMTPMTAAGFESKPSAEIKRRLSNPNIDPLIQMSPVTPMYAGFACNVDEAAKTIEIGIAVHDGDYSIDYSIQKIQYNDSPLSSGPLMVDHITRQLRHISKEHLFKFVGGGVTEKLHEMAPTLCTRIWLDLDMVPMVFKVRDTARPVKPSAANDAPKPRPIDEQADSAVRKLVMYFGPSHNPRLSIGYRNQVEVDANGITHILDGVEEYRNTCREGTWNALNKYADDLRERGIKIGFFSSTPQGGGVALMRHALIRLCRILGVNATWYVPKPSPAVFRHTKNNHNILQGVADPNLRPTKEATDQFTEWMVYNAERYWLSEGGPLAEGGIDVAFIDDPQMPTLIPLIKKARPDLPIVYRSHIEIRSDLVHVAGSPQAEVWDYLWERIKLADLFISHPVAKFVPSDVPIETLALLPAATDWLDGLSKPMRPWDLNYYMRVFKSQCSDIRMNKLLWPARGYICQVARFDPAKGIPDVIDSFCKLRRRLDDILPASKTPQLLICGHGAIDDPDASIIYDQTMALLEKEEYAPYASDIVAAVNVSDEVGTCGNAASWLYLASKLSKGEKLKPNGRWINDMMREDAGEPYREGEPRLKRDNINIQG